MTVSRGRVRQAVLRALLREFPGRRIEVEGKEVRFYADGEPSQVITVTVANTAHRASHEVELVQEWASERDAGEHDEIVQEIKTVAHDLMAELKENRTYVTKVSIKALSESLSSFLGRVFVGRPLIITKYGKPDAAILSIEDAERLFGAKFWEHP
ncbi:type II toxin-antitoxin system prevent-host-death family antitoxin [Mesorhizobium sp. B1-1-5]|uniref:type II toxin-antitoxin system prevent-host-death family antitoxin n=1 Tax=Mesorhizobium sp. B1-1-5 TaxID=2589979 RepID=UPI001126527F|nr:type II toxin-antitoxin system prevent-host-death family antitoxin [Mesorhizobium sp. B1-1-5]TPO01478.1 type II toxin-antitoxin system prevent-host-death family antitoxin [Mesorhizobium sp. B1-1-5]